MKKIIWYWNLVYYHVFKELKALHKRFTSINSNYGVIKTNALTEFYKTYDVANIFKLNDDMFNDVETGLLIHWANAIIYFLLVLLMVGILNFIDYFSNTVNSYNTASGIGYIFFLIYLLVPPLSFNYLTLYKNNRYLSFFEIFQQLNTRETKKHSRIALVIGVSLLMFCICSFII